MPSEVKLPAKVIQILDWYEVPELLLIRASNFEFILAVRSAEVDGAENVYVGGSMTIRRLRDYANGKCDLRYALAHANLRRFWRFTYEMGSEEVLLKRVKRSDPELVKSIPSQGLFASDHEDIDLVKTYVPDSIETFRIDGSWDLGEFSQLYGQIEDVYYLSSDIGRFDSPQTTADERDVIAHAFDRSWDGGGSYVAFYRKVANDNDYHAPLRVRGIEYNSPGFVKIHARSENFALIMAMLQYFANHEVEAKKSYNKLSIFMTAAKMKQKGFRNTHMDQVQRDDLESRAKELSEHIPGVSFDTLKKMTNGNSLVAAKVLGSIFRRIMRLYQYFDEGRVKYDGVVVH